MMTPFSPAAAASAKPSTISLLITVLMLSSSAVATGSAASKKELNVPIFLGGGGPGSQNNPYSGGGGCPTGYFKPGNSNICVLSPHGSEEVSHPCAVTPGLCAHYCVEAYNNYHVLTAACECAAGYVLLDDGSSCVLDHDLPPHPCLHYNGGCAHFCIEQTPQYPGGSETTTSMCQCEPGYKLAKDGMGCKYINN